MISVKKFCYAGIAYTHVNNCTVARLQPHIDILLFFTKYSALFVKSNFGNLKV